LLEAQLLLRGRSGVGGRLPGRQRTLEKVTLDTALAQQSIDLLQTQTQGQVVDVADDGGQVGPQFLWKRQDLASHELVYMIACLPAT